MGDAAALCQGARLGLGVGRRVKDHTGGGEGRVGTQLPHKLETVHGRHENVGDDQIGVRHPHLLEPFQAIAGLEQAMAAIAE